MKEIKNKTKKSQLEPAKQYASIPEDIPPDPLLL
jgi:hypothetical protein